VKQRILSSAKFLFFLALGGVLLWLAISGQDFDQVISSMQDSSLLWIGLSVLLGIISHISRAVRWNILIQPLGYRPRLLNTFMAVMIGYFANLAFPRLGEVSKCVALKRYEGVPVNKLLGTMIVERAVDLVSLLTVTGLLLLLQFSVLRQFFGEYIVQPLQEKVSASSNSLLWLGVAAIVLALVATVIGRQLIRRGVGHKVKELMAGFIEGLKSVGKMQDKWWFLFHSVLIWLLYYLMTYVALLALGATNHLGLLAGLAVFVFGSFGMVAPVQGGIGAYHYMAKETLKIYGVPETDALAFAFLIHSAQTLMIIVLGFASVIGLPLLNKQPRMSQATNLTHKIQSLTDLSEQVHLWRQQHLSIVFTNGCFDILHVGHIHTLANAAAEGDRLIVGLNSDASVQRLKGPHRPINGEMDRALLLAALAMVDAVVLFGEDTPIELIRTLQPDVLVKGGDYLPHEVVGYEEVTTAGGRIAIVPFQPGYSTTQLEKKLKQP
jgi:rfaE bifunctional protein nucleotidyltransferase chain/domain